MSKALVASVCALFLCVQVNAQEAILHAFGPSAENEYCIVFNSSWTPLPPSLDNAAQYQLVNLTSSVLCHQTDLPPAGLNGKAVVVMRGNCSFEEKALIAQSSGARAILIASKTSLTTPSAINTDKRVNILVALVRYKDVLNMQEAFKDSISVKLYAPPAALFDYSILVILFISVFTLALGGYWSGAAEQQELNLAVQGGRKKAESSDEIQFTPLKVVIFVLGMCGILVLLYFFYKWLVYVMIAMFCIASAMAVYGCLAALVQMIPCGRCSFSFQDKTVEIQFFFLAAFCIAVSVLWAVYRNEDRWIWILQDVLGIAFCLNFMRVLKISSFKICVILLSLLLVYDVFFVFITPFLTKNGESIMVQVAAGPGATGEKRGGNMVEVPAEPTVPYEKLPIVMRVPRLSSPTQYLCGMEFSLLGYGDIIVPGLLVAYCHRFDVWNNNSTKIYYISCTIAYGVGMIVTLVVMVLSKMGQPALLYLVPCTLVTSALVAWRRKEMKRFWAGTIYEVLDSSKEPLIQDGGESCGHIQ
ncbi:signal peptide peptidase-like 2A isoform X1 [Acipenser oxyrinchus oxyrinchus]|uniref:Signal peptide peptidase-like 2A isoform X1 n=1 Tax=Acipenser oxyrinchus oxyrinchus TaxID=40147 RepID=A0AAD8CFG1_ACIOX|nr:signal peptide peptidase-like 2A isoform X1 [Acipenser oxyrinchus oxyrinchus]